MGSTAENRDDSTGTLMTVALRPLRLSILSIGLLTFTQGQTPETLTLPEAVRLALDASPEVTAARASASAHQGLVIQGGLRPNPTFTLQTENWRFYGTPGFETGDDLDVFAFFSQPFETAGKRDRRTEYAEQRRKIAVLEQEAIEWSVRQNVKQAFLEALLARRELQLIRESSSDFEQITEYHRIRMREGEIAEADLIKVLLEQDRFALSENEAGLAASQALLRLRKVMGREDISGEIELVAPAGTPVLPEGESYTSFLQRARGSRPEARISRAEVESSRSRLLLAESLARPDWELIVGYKRTEGYNTLLGGVSVPLPFFDNNRGNIQFESGQVNTAEARLERTIRQVDSEVAMAADALRQRYHMLRSMEGGLLDRAEESLRIAVAAYQEGATDLLRLLDAQRARNEIALLHARQQLGFELAVVALETAVGQENLQIGEDLLSVPSNP